MDIYIHAIRRGMASIEGFVQSIFWSSGRAKLSKIATKLCQVRVNENSVLKIIHSCRKFLERVYQTPNDYRRHIRFMLGAIVIEVHLQLVSFVH